MWKKKWIAMLLAGGQGSRLGLLTKNVAKPAVPFGAKYRIIDFSLSNCTYSGIDTVGVLTQYKPQVLNSYIGIGSAWDLDYTNGGVFILQPFMSEKGGNWYKGTASAIYENIDFVNQYDPDYVLVISGDHIYKMDYSLMLNYHKVQKADATIAVIQVPWEEASRFGIMDTDANGKITEFVEKPAKPKSNLASMGIYIFNWPTLRRFLEEDNQDPYSDNDFGKNIIPKMLNKGRKLFAYKFKGYWKDVGTIESYYAANMDLLNEKPELDLFDESFKVYSNNSILPPHYLGPKAKVTNSLIPDGCMVLGEVENSVLFSGVFVGEGTKIKDSIILPHVKIGPYSIVYKAIIGENTIISNESRIGCKENGKLLESNSITVIGDNLVLAKNTIVENGKSVEKWLEKTI
ncbi:MAG: glucose-phosphate adenylyltransferase [Clostridia bacterium]|jgi:glucose-1-phosphate adenylyltransferase|nr:glucose-phosphate adenylyltransferase [Clostridia bacterium]